MSVITELVANTTWAAQNTMWAVNLVIMYCINNGMDPPPLTRDFFYGCYQASCLETKRKASKKRKMETDYLKCEIDKLKRAKYIKENKELFKGISRKKIKLDDATLAAVELDTTEEDAAKSDAAKRDKARSEEAASVGTWKTALEAVLDDVPFDTRRPLKGMADQMEQIIRSELIPNSITYVSETYRARRRLYVEAELRSILQTKSHIQRVATHLLQVIDGKQQIDISTDGRIDWAPVINRVRTQKLLNGFKKESESADADYKLTAMCKEITSTFQQPLCASPENLKTEPHKFLAPLHMMLQKREQNNQVIEDDLEVDEDEVDEDGVENLDEEEIEDFQDDDEKKSLQKLFTLLPTRSGRAAFVFLDAKRVAGVGLNVAENGPWFDALFDFSNSIPCRSKLKGIQNMLRTDGVQLKVGLSRAQSPLDELYKRGYKKLNAHFTKDLQGETRGVFVLDNTSIKETTIERPVIGLDPGVKDVFTSVSSEEGSMRCNHISNDHWSQEQRKKLIHKKNARWKSAVGGITDCLDQMAQKTLKTSDYGALVAAVNFRLQHRKTLWAYQMRRNRQNYRFSCMLSRLSAMDRLCNSIINHEPIKQRKNRQSPMAINAVKAPTKAPLIMFGGGQFACGGKGLASVPKKQLVRKLGTKAVVCITDEYNTSAKCSKCGTRLTDPDLGILGKTYEKKDKTRLRRCPRHACFSSQSSDGVSCSSVDEDSPTPRFRHWNRDVNAAINMLNAGKEWLLHKRRPPALCKAASPKLAQTPKLVKSQAQPQGGHHINL
jgi:hypothetical protein